MRHFYMTLNHIYKKYNKIKMKQGLDVIIGTRYKIEPLVKLKGQKWKLKTLFEDEMKNKLPTYR